eukprot:4518845-Pyramimonas_sp.AAC.1
MPFGAIRLAAWAGGARVGGVLDVPPVHQDGPAPARGGGDGRLAGHLPGPDPRHGAGGGGAGPARRAARRLPAQHRHGVRPGEYTTYEHYAGQVVVVPDPRDVRLDVFPPNTVMVCDVVGVADHARRAARGGRRGVPGGGGGADHAQRAGRAVPRERARAQL